MAKLINDGYTFAATFKPRLGIPAFKIKYRPALPEEVLEYQLVRKQDAKECMDAMAKVIVKHLVSWDVEKPTSNDTAEISRDNLARIPMPALDWILETIFSYTNDGDVGKDEKN